MAFYYYALLVVFIMILPCWFFVSSIVSYSRHSTKLVKTKLVKTNIVKNSIIKK